MKLKPTVDIETLLVNLPDALAEVRKLPDIESWWLDLAFGVTPALMVRYDVTSDPKTERIRLWSVDQLKGIWASLEGKEASVRIREDAVYKMENEQ
jgi:hypothetical protein